MPTSVLAVLAIASGAAARQGPLDARALQLRDEGLALAGRDDGVSMERALARLEDLVRRSPGLLGLTRRLLANRLLDFVSQEQAADDPPVSSLVINYQDFALHNGVTALLTDAILTAKRASVKGSGLGKP